ncbi:hypothetical protein [Baekduia sp.]|uniref:hypothetical protein n=1 Tax=Baekduia sp. TaxID=2600305 RepID=UPI002E054302|nr:hypothetical protein [Baekduia sp.]
MADQLRNGEHTVLADRRRTGKATVALGALDVLAGDGWTVVGLDLSEAGEGGPVLAEGLVAQVALQEARVERGEGFGYEIWDLLRPAGGADERDADAIDDALTSLRASGSAGEQLTWALDFATSTVRGAAGTILFLDEIQRLEYWPDHDAVAVILDASAGEPHRTMLAANRTAEMAQFADVDLADATTADAGVAAARDTRLWDAGR